MAMMRERQMDLVRLDGFCRETWSITNWLQQHE